MSAKILKVAFVGSGAAGKTTIATRLTSGEFVDVMMTVGLNVETWSIANEEGQPRVKVALFDLSGQPQFRFMQNALLVGTHAVLIVVDMTRITSLFEVDNWIPLIRHVPRDRWLLVGNKEDEPTTVTREDIENKAKDLGIPYVIISAKTGKNFEELVSRLKNLCLS
ncbi:MAG: Rab family GTPase [Candidatus Thorarchaeota archaeon]